MRLSHSNIAAIKKVKLIWLFIILTPLFIGSILHFKYFPDIQFYILSFTALLYILLAILHHFLDKTLKLEIVIEYLLIAAFALIIVRNLLI